MKRTCPIVLITLMLAMASIANAANETLAGELVDLAYAEDELIPHGWAKDPAARDHYYRQVAVDFYAERFTKVELQDLVGFFRGPAGRRLTNSQQKIHREVVAVSFPRLLSGQGPPSTRDLGEGDERVVMATELMKTPYFAREIDTLAAQYADSSKKLGDPSKVVSPKTSQALISRLYVERYSRRFGQGLLKDMLAFFQSQLGAKYAKVSAELPAKLNAAADDFKG